MKTPLNTGSHSLNELQNLMQGLKYFRYFPSTSGMNPVDCLKATVSFLDRKSAEHLIEFVDSKKKYFAKILISVTLLEDCKIIRIEIQNGEEYENLNGQHFSDCVLFENQVIEFCSGESLSVGILDSSPKYYFNP